MLEIGKQEAQAAARVIESGQLFRFGVGSECQRFERELAEKTGTKHALVVTSGTAALICGLAGMGIGPGDEVIVPAYTFMATPAAVVAVGAIPIIAEIDESLMLDPADVEAKVTERTKAVIPVHMVGLPADMNGIMRVARRHGLKVLEDGCQADGGSYKGKRVGAIGQAGAFSFNYYKNVTCGEGGAVVTNDSALYERAMVMHDPGTAFRPHRADLSISPFIGMAFRMNEIQAAVLRVQLRRIDGLLRKLRANKQKLIAGIADTGLKLATQNDPEGECSTTLALLFGTERQARAFVSQLERQGVGASRPINSGRHVYSNWDPILEQRGAHHPALDPFRLPANKGSKVKYTTDMCPRSTDLLSRAVFLGVKHSWTAAEVRARIKAIRAAAEGMGGGG